MFWMGKNAVPNPAKTLRCSSHRYVNLCDVHPIAETISAVCIPPWRQSPSSLVSGKWTISRNKLKGEHIYPKRRDIKCWCIPLQRIFFRNLESLAPQYDAQHTAETVSAMCIIRQRLTPQWDVHRGDWLSGMLHTAETIDYLSEIKTWFKNTLACLSGLYVDEFESWKKWR